VVLFLISQQLTIRKARYYYTELFALCNLIRVRYHCNNLRKDDYLQFVSALGLVPGKSMTVVQRALIIPVDYIPPN